MANRPNNVQVRKDLTDYAFGIMQDARAALAVANLLAPVVPTGGTSGLFNKFDTSGAFKAYAAAVARRAVGGHAQEIGLLSDTANYNVKPNGLRIKMDAFEKTQAGGAVALLEQSKTRTLTIASYLSYLAAVVAVIKAAVSATNGKGNWADPNVDPIHELNDQVKAVYLASGIVPNNVAMDFGAWCVLSGNPNVIKRMPGADIAAVTPVRVQGMLVAPNAKITVVETAGLTGGGLGNASATKQGILGGSVLTYFNATAATPYDPSFCKTFSPSASLFTEVYTYREEPHFDWFESDWEDDIQVVSSLLCKRIDVTGANT
jgi:hypothetical protein